MKKTFFAIGLVCAGLSSCADSLLETGQVTPANPGDEVQFSAIQQKSEYNNTDNPERDSRAHYGLYSSGSDSYFIYWDDGDRIAIFSPQARQTNPSGGGSGREADYKILLTNDNGTEQSGTLSKINMGDTGLQWGTDNFHDFYGFFPVSAKEEPSSENSLRLTLPVLQTPSAMRVVKPGEIENIEIPKSKDETEPVTGTTYIARPNMENCFMYAHGYGYREEGSPITLNFKPIVTTLEVIVRGPKEGKEPIQVSQVVIRSEDNICGKFDLQIVNKDEGDPEATPAGDGKVTIVNDGTLSNTITIPVYYNHTLDEDGVGATTGNNLEPVTLQSGDVLVVRAFLLPETVETSRTAVTVHMVGSGTRTKELTTAAIVAQKINITTLPLLIKSESNFWMTQLDDNTYFSQLSIPGGHNSYDINLNNATDHPNIDKTYQTRTIDEQLAAGARAFSFVVGLRDGEYTTAMETWNKDYELYTYPGGSLNSKGTLSSILDDYANKLLSLNKRYHEKYSDQVNPKEFLVLNIGYQQRISSGDNNTQRNLEISRWLKELDRIIDAKAAEWEDKLQAPYFNGFTNEITPETTLSDLAGKIVVFVTVQTPNWPKSTDGYQIGSITPTTNFNYTPSTDARYYVAMCPTMDENSSDITSTHAANNDRDYDYVYLMHPYGEGVNSDVTVWRQQLERLSYSGSTSNSELTAFSTRTQTKKDLVKKLFEEAVENNKAPSGNVGNWYINNLGGFNVVNDEESYASNKGWGGDNVGAAGEINKYAYDYLSDSENNSAPCGVVLMNFIGAESVDNTSVYGVLLPQIIIENNYRFALKVKGSSSAQSKAKLPPSDF